MKYGLLPMPHPNARYQEATRHLLINELEITFKGIGFAFDKMAYETFSGLTLLTFESEPLKQDVLALVERLSAYQALFSCHDDCLRPLGGVWQPYFPKDLPAILKYSGKTNEAFTHLMIQVAIMSGGFAGQASDQLMVLDPMCGKGTTLFQSMVLGYDCAGIEQDPQAIHGLDTYLKRYLKHDHYKHATEHQTILFEGKKIGVKHTLKTANDVSAYKAGDTLTVQYAQGDTTYANVFYKKNSFHALVTDLPYGVQHKGGLKGQMTSMPALLKSAAPAWKKVLKPGGVIVIAYNTHHFDRLEVDEVFIKEGFKCLKEDVYGRFEHWVEQAVNRDLLVYLKP